MYRLVTCIANGTPNLKENLINSSVGSHGKDTTDGGLSPLIIEVL